MKRPLCLCVNCPAPEMLLKDWSQASCTKQWSTFSSSEMEDVHHMPGTRLDIQRYGCKACKCFSVVPDIQVLKSFARTEQLWDSVE